MNIYPMTWLPVEKIQIRTHHYVAEKAIRCKLPNGSVVHHVDGDVNNNAHDNLVVCPSQAYHKLLHLRQSAFNACGNANWLKCHYCKKYDDPSNMKLMKMSARPSPRSYHIDCNRQYQKSYYKLRK